MASILNDWIKKETRTEVHLILKKLGLKDEKLFVNKLYSGVVCVCVFSFSDCKLNK